MVLNTNGRYRVSRLVDGSRDEVQTEHEIRREGDVEPKIVQMVVVLGRVLVVKVGRRGRSSASGSPDIHLGVTTASHSPHGPSRRCNFVVERGRWHPSSSLRSAPAFEWRPTKPSMTTDVSFIATRPVLPIS